MGRLLSSIGLLVLTVSQCLAQTCPGELGWMMFEGHCYKFQAYPRQPKLEATKTCQNDGASLLSINTNSEHQFIDRWLQQNDEARQEWLTSGVIQSDGVKWDGDGSAVANLAIWHYPDGIRLPGSVVVLGYTGTEYKWNVGIAANPYPFICEISVNEVYRISQEHRDFDYGLDVDNPSLAPRGPTFLTEPRDLVILGETATFHMDCLAVAMPEASYEWLKEDANGNMVKLDPRAPNSRYTFTTGRLNIDFPQKSDAGKYQCKAMNQYGQILSKTAEVRFGDLGEFSNVEPAPVNGIEYQGAQLECPYITGFPAISYQWYKGRFEFIRPDFQTHTFISSNGKLYFSALYESDADTYYCVATLTSMDDPENVQSYQPPSRISLGFQLTVRGGAAFDQPPDIQDEFINLFPSTPMRGSDVRMECFAYGIGPLQYSWSRVDGKPLPKGHIYSSAGRVLTLFEVGLEDDGIYECRVSREKSGQDDVKTTELRIQAKPFFTYDLTNQHVDIGGQLTWTCEAGGKPTPTYTWYRNGTVLTSSEGVTVNKNHLVIDKLDPKRDNGMYQCGATNRYGTTFSSAQLRVLNLAPSFTKSPMLKSITSARGGNVTIICNPTAAPKPTYKWLKDGIDLGLTQGVFDEFDRMKVLQNGNLLITGVVASDQGTYTCQAENSLGTAEDYSILNTIENIAISLPPSDDRVEVNLTVALMCQASAPPNVDMVYIWKFNDHIINFDREPEFRMGIGSQEGTLYIIAAQFKNEGSYTCIATTGIMSVEASAYLRLMGPPGEPLGVLVKDTPFVIKEDVDHPDNTADRDTTRWLMWTDGDSHFGPITHYTIQFRTSFDRNWRVHPGMGMLPKELTLDDTYPDKRYARLTGLKAGTMISFRVIAINAYGAGYPSLPTVDTKIPDAKPAVRVKNVRGGGGSVGDLAIVWDPLSEEDFNGAGLHYRVGWRRADQGLVVSDNVKWNYGNISHDKACAFVPDFRTGIIHICKFVELVGADLYYMPYQAIVQAFNNKGGGPVTEPTIVMSAMDLPLIAPTKVQADQYNATALMVTWDPVPNDRLNAKGRLKGYKINYWKMNYETESDALQNIIELPDKANNLDRGLIIGLEPFEWYTFNVQSYNEAGNGPKSSDYQQQTYNRAPQLFPTEVHVFSMEGFNVRVVFRGISTLWREEPLLGYIVQYWKIQESFMSATEVNIGKTTTGVIHNLTNSEIYKLRVFAFSRGGRGSRSSPSVYFTVGDGEVILNNETDELMNVATSLTVSYVAMIFIAILTTAYIQRMS